MCWKKQENEENDGANYVEVIEKTTFFLTRNVIEKNGLGVWHIDAGVVIICVVKKYMFIDLDEIFFSMAKFGDDKNIVVKGKGQIMIKAKNKDHHIISVIFYAPCLTYNLLSVKQFKENGLILHIKKMSIKVTN